MCQMAKTIRVKKYENNYFYKAFDVMPEELLSDLFKSAGEWLDKTRKPITEEVYPPEATRQLLDTPEFINSDLWERFYSTIKSHIAKYCEVSGMDISKIKLHTTWITRIADIEFPGSHTKEELKNRLRQHSAYGNMHSHKDNPIGVVYYLKNPDPKYGTTIKLTDNKLFVNDGEENSLLIFNPELYHTAIYPSWEIAKESPRITVVVDCCFT